jgi:hypothetical protein
MIQLRNDIRIFINNDFYVLFQRYDIFDFQSTKSQAFDKRLSKEHSNLSLLTTGLSISDKNNI